MLKALMALLVAMSSTVSRCEAMPRRGTADQEGEDLVVEATTPSGSGANASGGGARRGKALQFYVEAPEQGAFLLDLDDELEAALAASRYQMELADSDDNEIASRARPGRPKPDSPVYYVRLPPSPYMFVPGVGYVSQPPSLRPPPVRTPPDSPFVDLPVRFVSNAKPTGVYSWSAPAHVAPPRPQAPQPPRRQPPVNNLDKGPYLFNGRPTDIFLLRSAYDSLYADALQNFYP